MKKHWFIAFTVLLLIACQKGEKPQNSADEHPTIPQNTSEEAQAKIYLVRHAEKANDGSKNPPLTEEGIKRAENLKNKLLETNISKIYSTDFTRTKDTAKPLAEALGLKLQIYQPGNEAFINLLKNNKNNNFLVVGHSNSTPQLVNSLLGEQKYAPLDESEYDKLFIISRYSDKLECVQTTFN